ASSVSGARDGNHRQLRGADERPAPSTRGFIGRSVAGNSKTSRLVVRSDARQTVCKGFVVEVVTTLFRVIRPAAFRRSFFRAAPTRARTCGRRRAAQIGRASCRERV